MKLHQGLYLFILTLSVSANAAESHLVFNEGKNVMVCQKVWAQALSGTGDLYEAIVLAGGIMNYTDWHDLVVDNRVEENGPEYSMLDFDNNGTKEPVVKGMIGCSGYQPFYRVLQNEEVNENGETNLKITEIWGKPGVGWCFNPQYEHYGIPNAFDLGSFQYKGTLYLTLKSYEFGRATHKQSSFVIAKYTGIMNKTIATSEPYTKMPTDKLEVICRFSYSAEVNQALKAQPSAAGTLNLPRFGGHFFNQQEVYYGKDQQPRKASGIL